jgi:hypothetical protein
MIAILFLTSIPIYSFANENMSKSSNVSDRGSEWIYSINRCVQWKLNMCSELWSFFKKIVRLYYTNFPLARHRVIIDEEEKNL